MTSNYVRNAYRYIVTGYPAGDEVKLSWVGGGDAETTAKLSVEGEEDRVFSRGDEVVVAGEGPWFVSFEETRADVRPIAGFAETGMATYMIAEIDGIPLITNHYWIGLREPRDP